MFFSTTRNRPPGVWRDLARDWHAWSAWERCALTVLALSFLAALTAIQIYGYLVT